MAEPPRDRPPAVCDVAPTELLRAAHCVAPDLLVQARMVLGAATITEVTTAVFESAGRISSASEYFSPTVPNERVRSPQNAVS